MTQYLSMGIGGIIFLALYTAVHNRKIDLKGMLFPHLRHPSINEEILVILNHPLFWLASIGIFASFGASLAMGVSSIEWFAFAVVLTLFLATLDSVLVWLFEGKYREPLRFIMGSMIFGGLAGMTAFLINTVMNLGLKLVSPYNTGIVVLAIAPLVEETLKLMGVYFYSTSKRFRGPLDGIVIGFSTGVGFSVLENLFYIASKIDSFDSETLLFRALYNTIAHGSFTAIGGFIIGRIKRDFGSLKLKLLGIPIFTAVLIHSAFNIFAVIDVIGRNSTVMNYYLFTPLLDLGLIIVVLFLIWKEQRVNNS